MKLQLKNVKNISEIAKTDAFCAELCMFYKKATKKLIMGTTISFSLVKVPTDQNTTLTVTCVTFLIYPYTISYRQCITKLLISGIFITNIVSNQVKEFSNDYF